MKWRFKAASGRPGGKEHDQNPRQLELPLNRDDPVEYLAPPPGGYRVIDRRQPEIVHVLALCPYCGLEHECVRFLLGNCGPDRGGRS